jgi:hypothetical protein
MATRSEPVWERRARDAAARRASWPPVYESAARTAAASSATPAAIEGSAIWP